LTIYCTNNRYCC